MKAREEIVTAVVAAAGGELASRIRLQKIVYLLGRMGLENRFDDYQYYHYGPYSANLDYAVVDAKAFDLIKEEQRRRDSDRAPYSVFTLGKRADQNAFHIGKLGDDQAGNFIQRFVKTNITVLELAATIDWLWHQEKYVDWQGEIVKRKGVKVQHGRFEKAVGLLNDLKLTPPKPVVAA